MLHFLRRVRQNLITQNNLKTYALYGIGEIFLVVIGIMIALALDNHNKTRIEKEELKNYLQKIAINVKSDLSEAERMLMGRTSQSALCAKATTLIGNREFNHEAQKTITNALFAMIIEQPINFNRSGFESLKNSGHLQHLDDSNLENLLYAYYRASDKVVFEENSLQLWSNDLDLQLHKSGFFSEWLELEKRPNPSLDEAIGNYSEKLTKHEGHNIVLSIFYRGFLFTEFLTGFYEEQITSGGELIKAIDEYVKE
ncbi:hypothetical protein [Marinoscillum sp. MHG1-6]|uniref:hypothetical protein n=1 Tax=Marinoscillum sp. MHG1-6 TaxID=2959627 RepID=UPI0021584104|nr:hypothetical protein [Marinoscillum sp. MHG1-6]